jgi:hypothetical protein
MGVGTGRTAEKRRRTPSEYCGNGLLDGTEAKYILRKNVRFPTVVRMKKNCVYNKKFYDSSNAIISQKTSRNNYEGSCIGIWVEWSRRPEMVQS